MIIAAACSSRVWLYSHALLTCRSSRRRRSHLAQVVVSHNARPTPRERHARQHVVKPIPRFDSIDAFEKQLQPSQGLAWWGLPFILTASGGSSGGGSGGGGSGGTNGAAGVVGSQADALLVERALAAQLSQLPAAIYPGGLAHMASKPMMLCDAV